MKTILYVDDHQELLQLYRTLLESRGYLVLTSFEGADALHLFECNRPDVVLLDYRLKEVSGEDVALEMRRIDRRVPIIMISGLEIPARARSIVNATVQKGVEFRVILEEIEKLTISHTQSAA